LNVDGWCGHCGESFRLAQVVEAGAGGRCPRCGVVYNHDYNAVVTSSVSAFIRAAEAMHDAAQQMTETAPLLHVDREALYKALDEYLDR
jgi:transposase-like protein